MTQEAIESRNGKALVALWLGIIGLLLSPVIIGGLLGIVALIIGIIALKHPARRGAAIAGIVTGALAIPMMMVGTLMIAILLPALGRARSIAQETRAMAQMHQIITGVEIYASDSNGPFPPHFANLKPYGGDLPKLLKDPRGSTSPIVLTPGADLKTQMAEIDAASDFYYAGAGLRSNSPNPSQTIIVYDKGLYGRNRIVGFADGHVERFPMGSPELRHAVEANNAARAGAKASLLPADLMGPPVPLAPEAP